MKLYLRKAWYKCKWFIIPLFTVRIIKRTIHGGMGYTTGDGIDISDTVLEWGIAPRIYLRLILSVRVSSLQNSYTFHPLKGQYTWLSL